MEIKRIKLFINHNEKSEIVAKDLELELKKYGFEIVDKKYDLAISVGGDGSFLKTLRETNFDDSIYYIGINSGTLGFLQEIDIKDFSEFVKRLSTNNFKVEELSVQETKVITNDTIYTFNSLNEMVVRNKHFKTLRLPTYVDNEFLEEFSGDGLLVSTSTGSTAYNMSLGGSIIYNTLKTLSITPIAPLNNKAYNCLTNSVVVPDDKIIIMKPLDNKKYNNLFFMIDGVSVEIDDVLRVETKICDKTIKCLRMNDYHFIKLVNQKILEK